MAITRTQIAKQLLAQGGRTGFQGGGADMGTKAGDKRAARDNREIGARMDRTRSLSKDQIKRARDTQKVKQAFTKETLFDKIPSSLGVLTKMSKFNPKFMKEFAASNPNLLDYINSLDEDDQSSAKLASALKEIGYGDFLAEKKGAPGLKFAGDVGGLEKFVKTRNPDGSPATFGFTNVEDRGDPSILFPQGIMTQASSTMDQGTTTDADDETDKSFLRFRAEGGPIGGEYDFESARQMYGLGKLVKKVTRTVKKIAKSPIGKAALLYTGAGALGNLAGGSGLAGAFKGFTSPTSFLGGAKNIFKSGGLKNILVGGKNFYGERAQDFTPFSGIFGSGGELNPLTAISAASVAAALLTPKQEEEAQALADETGFSIEEARNSILARARDDYKMDFRARGFRAEGGIMRLGYKEGDLTQDANYKGWVKLYEKNPDVAAMNKKHKEYLNFYERDKTKQAEGSKEPVAKKTMPLLDMDGKEMDLRAEGGFVPIGRMEKADDVPARLSKNEFVFTADAVRNAGDGNVDKGAEVMYNMMKNLESGGDVSEESQGLEGARRMFQTSQRLEEVL